MYQAEAIRVQKKKEYANIDGFLRSLRMRVIVSIDDEEMAPRLAQLSQKTNQFNLTMKRYSVADVVRYTKDVKSTVFGFSVEDSFGSYGITGLCVLNLEEGASTTLLLACNPFLILVNISPSVSLIDINKSPYYQLDLTMPGICPVDANSLKAILDIINFL